MGWLRELLLDSPVPPSNYLPDRRSRLADARSILRRRFGLEASRPPSQRIRDVGSAHPFATGTRVVSGAEIQAELEADLTTVNPPMMPGWLVALMAIALGAFVFGLRIVFAPDAPSEVGAGLWLIALAFVVPVAAALVAGAHLRMIELDETGVSVRRWDDVWLGRPGRLLGPAAGLTARLRAHTHLILDGPVSGPVDISLRAWPPEALAEITEELPTWGIDCDFAPHHRHPHARRQRRRRRRS
jgi:hypothetical protein